VRYITPQPSLSAFSAYAHSELAYTQDGSPSAEVGVAIGGPIVEDKLGFRISAWVRRDGGWIDRVDYQNLDVTDHDANRVDTYVLRAAMTWKPVDNLTITPGIDYQKRDQHNYDYYWVSISDPAAGQFLSGTPDRMADPDRFYLATLKVEYDLPAVRIISNTSYYDRLERVNGYSGTLYNLSYFQQIIANGVDPQGNPCTNNCAALYPLLTPTGPNVPGLPNYLAYNLITNTQVNFTQEVRIQSADASSRLNWTAGVFYGQDSQRSTEEIRDPELGQLSEILWDETTLEAWGENLLPGDDDYINSTRGHDSQVALFADATLSVTDSLKLEGGLRYAWTHFDFTNFNDGPQDLLDDGGVPATASGSKDERPLTPKVSVTYQVTGDDLVYATVAEGYRIGGATPPLPVAACGGVFPDSYNSDTVLSYEIGSKDRFFDRRLFVAASAYYIQWNNIQQDIYVPTCGIQYTANVGDAVSKGFDFQAEFNVSHALELEMTVGYTDAGFTKTALSSNGAILAIKGDSLGAVPWTVTVGAQYNFRFLDQDAFIRGDDEFESHRTTPIPGEDPGTTYYDPGLVPNPATNQLSARAGVTFPKWEIELFVNNLLNAHPQLDLTHQDQFTTLFEATTFRPRTVGISATVRY
jgi:outer membrane receptor protein involved in Fe transport